MTILIPLRICHWLVRPLAICDKYAFTVSLIHHHLSISDQDLTILANVGYFWCFALDCDEHIKMMLLFGYIEKEM